MNKQHASISSDPPSIAEQKWEGLADETRIAPVDYTLINYQYLKWHVKKTSIKARINLASQTPPFARSDGGEGVWSIELTFLSQVLGPHVNCEYRYFTLEDGE